MQGSVWRHSDGVLLPCDLCVFKKLLCGLQSVVFSGYPLLQLHVGWETSQDRQPGPSSQ